MHDMKTCTIEFFSFFIFSYWKQGSRVPGYQVAYSEDLYFLGAMRTMRKGYRLTM